MFVLNQVAQSPPLQLCCAPQAGHFPKQRRHFPTPVAVERANAFVGCNLRQESFPLTCLVSGY